MKKIIGILLTVLTVLLLLSGCGIAQEEYDAVLAERDAAQAEVASLQSDLAKAQSQVGTLEGDLAKAEGQVESLQSSVAAAQTKYNTFKSDLEGAWTSLEGTLLVNYIVLGITSELLLDNLDGVYQGCSLMAGALSALGDSELEALWEQAFVIEGEDWNFYYTPFEAFIEVLAERIDSGGEALSNKL